MPVKNINNIDPTDYYYQEIESEQTPLYQDYLPEADYSPKLSELFFFVNIAVFCVLTVCLALILEFKNEYIYVLHFSHCF